MDGAHSIIAVVFVALLLTGGAIAVQHASKTTADKHTANETVMSDSPGELATLGNSSIDGAYYSETAKVTNNSSVVLDGNGTDYTWYDTNGTVRVESQAAANQTLYVDYDYWTRTDSQIAATGIIAMLIESAMWLPLILIVGLLFIAIAAFGGVAS